MAEAARLPSLEPLVLLAAHPLPLNLALLDRSPTAQACPTLEPLRLFLVLLLLAWVLSTAAPVDPPRLLLGSLPLSKPQLPTGLSPRFPDPPILVATAFWAWDLALPALGHPLLQFPTMDATTCLSRLIPTIPTPTPTTVRTLAQMVGTRSLVDTEAAVVVVADTTTITVGSERALTA